MIQEEGKRGIEFFLKKKYQTEMGETNVKPRVETQLAIAWLDGTAWYQKSIHNLIYQHTISWHVLCSSQQAQYSHWVQAWIFQSLVRSILFFRCCKHIFNWAIICRCEKSKTHTHSVRNPAAWIHFFFVLFFLASRRFQIENVIAGVCIILVYSMLFMSSDAFSHRHFALNVAQHSNLFTFHWNYLRFSASFFICSCYLWP